MGLWSRMTMIWHMKADAALDEHEDPREVLDFAYRQQQELLQTVKQGLIEVATSKRQLEMQSEKLRARVPQMEDQARRAVKAGREDLARIALQRKQTALAELEGLDRQVQEVGEEERKLAQHEQQLSARVEEFRTHRQVVSARYSAAEAQVRVNEALGGVPGQVAELTLALGRAEEKTERMLARASAIDALLDSGVLRSPVTGSDLVERELRDIAARLAVEDDLAAIKSSMEPDPSGETESPEKDPRA